MKISRIVAAVVVSGGLAWSVAGVASAHVVVRPSDVKTSTFQTFTVSVPTEENNPTVSIKLDVPDDVTSVRPTVKAGWTITMDKEGTGEDAKVTAITWSGGEIGVGLRDEFTFSAKTPDHPMDLEWHVDQTYKSGLVVSWNQAEENSSDESGATTGPFSVTKVATESDQDVALKNADAKAANAQQAANTSMYVGVAGVVLAVVAILIAMIRKPKSPSQQ